MKPTYKSLPCESTFGGIFQFIAHSLSKPAVVHSYFKAAAPALFSRASRRISFTTSLRTISFVLIQKTTLCILACAINRLFGKESGSFLMAFQLTRESYVPPISSFLLWHVFFPLGRGVNLCDPSCRTPIVHVRTGHADRNVCEWGMGQRERDFLGAIKWQNTHMTLHSLFSRDSSRGSVLFCVTLREFRL